MPENPAFDTELNDLLLSAGLKAAIFDFDGTLMDSMGLWDAIDAEFLGRFGHSFSRQLQIDIEGMNIDDTALYFKEHYSIPLNIREIKETWAEMSFEKFRSSIRPKKGARELILYMRSLGMKIGIATTNSLKNVEACLKNNGIYELFDAISTSEDGAKGKPDPQLYLLTAAKLGTAPESCIAFEDVPAGILSASRAGMRVIGVYDLSSEDEHLLKTELADYYIQDFTAFLPK